MVGRPILQASDPKAAVETIVAEIAAAQNSMSPHAAKRNAGNAESRITLRSIRATGSEDSSR